MSTSGSFIDFGKHRLTAYGWLLKHFSSCHVACFVIAANNGYRQREGECKTCFFWWLSRTEDTKGSNCAAKITEVVGEVVERSKTISPAAARCHLATLPAIVVFMMKIINSTQSHLTRFAQSLMAFGWSRYSN